MRKPKKPNPHIVKVLIEWMDERSREEQLLQQLSRGKIKYPGLARIEVMNRIADLNDAIRTVAMGVRGIETRMRISEAMKRSRKGAKS